MQLPSFLLRHLRELSQKIAITRPPDFVIGEAENPYLARWHIIPRNPIFNIYLHMILRDDDDRALHCHPWINCSIVLYGEYREVLFCDPALWVHGGTKRIARKAGSITLRMAGTAHRLEVGDGAATTLFLTGPRFRSWGFWCPQGWRDWREFTNPDDNGATTGRGCD